MGSSDNRLRKKWQTYGANNATKAEHSFAEVFKAIFEGSEYELTIKPDDFRNLYVGVELSEPEQGEIYNPPTAIKRHGLTPDAAIHNRRTGKTVYVEIKRQDGWVEGKRRSVGRGNAHERCCKYFTPGLLQKLRQAGNILEPDLPFWIVFEGDITRDPCRVREITYWFGTHKANYFFWRNQGDGARLVDHFEEFIAPLLE